MSYYDFWDFSGGGEYLEHYGVKGMKWKDHTYKSVSPDGTYTYDTVRNRTGSHIMTQTLVGGNNKYKDNTSHTVNKTTTVDRRAVVNPNAKKFGISLKSRGEDKQYTVTRYDTDKNGKFVPGTYHKEGDGYTHINENKDHYLQINYNKKKVDAAKNKAKSILNSVRSGKAESNIKSKISNIKNKAASINKQRQLQAEFSRRRKRSV